MQDLGGYDPLYNLWRALAWVASAHRLTHYLMGRYRCSWGVASEMAKGDLRRMGVLDTSD